MANLTKQKRDEMLAFLEQLKTEHNDEASIRAFNEIENHLTEKKFGLVFEEHTEEVDEKILTDIPVLCADDDRRLCKDESKPWNFIIQGDNLQALYLLEKTHRGKVDCIYIDPPYNKGNKDWKYNNDYVDSNDVYHHSKWLSMMKTRLLIAKRLLNPRKSILIVTIDEKEYAHLGCLLEELFPNARIQMVSSVISPQGNQRKHQFSRIDEYLYFVEIGDASVEKLSLSNEWRINAEDKRTTKLHWQQLIRNGSNGTRTYSPNLFYPIYVSKDGKRFLGVGEPLFPLSKHPSDVIVEDDKIAIWPFHSDGSEGRWACSGENLIALQKKGYVKLGKLKKDNTMYITYLQSGMIKKIEDGTLPIDGYNEDGSVISNGEHISFIPGTQWRISSHDASRNGSSLLHQIFLDYRFPFPKSLYAVYDTIRFFVESNPDAIIVDFFAGSGTTMHAVNLMNAKDNGNRRCIMITNNEVSADDEKQFAIDNYGNDEVVVWNKKPSQKNASYRINYKSKQFIDFKEKYGIAKFVTWPRTVCSINGVDVSGKVLEGNYGCEKETFEKKDEKGHKNCYKKSKVQLYPELETILMADGFTTNVKFFKCDWTPRKPEDYLLSNKLCLHIKEMIELQNHIEVDNNKYVLVLNEDDFNDYIMNDEIYQKIEKIWINQNIILDSKELKRLKEKEFKYIPIEYFGQELREAAE